MTQITILAEENDGRGKLLDEEFRLLSVDSSIVDPTKEEPPKSDGYVYLSESWKGPKTFGRNGRLLRTINPLFNSFQSIEDTDSKEVQYKLFKKFGVPTPKTYFARNLVSALFAIARLPGEKIVIKGSESTLGLGTDIEEKSLSLDFLREVNASIQYHRTDFFPPEYVLCIQEFMPNDGILKVLTVGEKCFPGLFFYNPGRWEYSAFHNVPVEQMEVKLVDLNIIQKAVARKAVRAIGLDFSVVDMLQHPRYGPVVLETNSVPSWEYEERKFGLGYTSELARHILQRVSAYKSTK